MTAQSQTTTAPGAVRNLVLATSAFALTFWVWNLVGPLSKTYTQNLDLSPTQTSILVAFPVLVGALGRIPVGALTDRFGGRVMFTVICWVSIIPTLLVGMDHDSFIALLVWGFLLGIAGTSFAIGIPFVNSWFPPHRRGFATGMFGAGMGGTALSALLTPPMAAQFGVWPTHALLAAALAVMGVVMWAFSRNAPAWQPSTEPAWPRLKDALRLPTTWQMSLLYAIAFGGFVAFSTYLPTLLTTAYHFAQTDAGIRTAGFSLAAVIARPVGGVLSDRWGPAAVCLLSFFATAVLAVVLAFQPPPELPAGAAFVLMAVALGLGTGGVFALVATLVEPARVGTVTGLVGAAGGLGGYFPPLVMGVVFQVTDSYVIGFVLLAATALVVGMFTLAKFGRGRSSTTSNSPGG